MVEDLENGSCSTETIMNMRKIYMNEKKNTEQKANKNDYSDYECSKTESPSEIRQKIYEYNNARASR